MKNLRQSSVWEALRGLAQNINHKMVNTRNPGNYTGCTAFIKNIYTGKVTPLSTPARKCTIFLCERAEADAVLPSSVVARLPCRPARGIPPAAVGRRF